MHIYMDSDTTIITCNKLCSPCPPYPTLGMEGTSMCLATPASVALQLVLTWKLYIYIYVYPLLLDGL